MPKQPPDHSGPLGTCWACSFGQWVGIGPRAVEHCARARLGRCFRPAGSGGDPLCHPLSEQRLLGTRPRVLGARGVLDSAAVVDRGHQRAVRLTRRIRPRNVQVHVAATRVRPPSFRRRRGSVRLRSTLRPTPPLSAATRSRVRR